MGVPSYTLANGIIEYICIIESNASVDMHFHDWSLWEETIEPSQSGPGEQVRTCMTCDLKEYKVINSIWQTTNILDHYTELPTDVCAGLNLWSILPHDPKYYVVTENDWGYHSSKNVPSITIPVNPGDKIYATSFGKAGENGHATANGIRVTFFDINGVVKTTDPAATYKEFTNNGGYLIAPEGCIAINIPLWNNNDDNEVYILNRNHIYEGVSCVICNNIYSDIEIFEGKVISILGDSISTFAGYIPVEDGFNLEHLSRYPQDNLLTDVNETWWMQVINVLNAKLGINDSWRGATVSGAVPVTTGTTGENAGMANLTRIQNLGSNGTPDIILFYGGTNDLAHVGKIGSFDPSNAPTIADLNIKKWDNLADGYINTLLRLKHYYPNTEIICLLPTYTKSYYSDAKLAEGNKVLSEICNYYNIKYIDLRNCGISVNNLPDGIHPDEVGMDYISNAVINCLLTDALVDKGENIVHKITNNLDNVTSSLSYYKGISNNNQYRTVITGDIIGITVLMDGVDITSECYSNNVIDIKNVLGDVIITIIGKEKPIYEDYIITDLENVCMETNIWKITEHNEKYYDGSKWVIHSSKNVFCVSKLFN